MIDIVLFVFFSIMAVRISRAIIKETAIYREFNQSRSLGVIVMLFPLGPLALITLPFRIGWVLAALAAAICYIPGFVTSLRQSAAFERSGTDRTQTAHKATTQAFGTSVFGLIYVAIFTALVYLGSSMYELGA